MIRGDAGEVSNARLGVKTHAVELGQHRHGEL